MNTCHDFIATVWSVLSSVSCQPVESMQKCHGVIETVIVHVQQIA